MHSKQLRWRPPWAAPRAPPALKSQTVLTASKARTHNTTPSNLGGARPGLAPWLLPMTPASCLSLGSLALAPWLPGSCSLAPWLLALGSLGSCSLAPWLPGSCPLVPWLLLWLPGSCSLVGSLALAPWSLVRAPWFLGSPWLAPLWCLNS